MYAYASADRVIISFSRHLACESKPVCLPCICSGVDSCLRSSYLTRKFLLTPLCLLASHSNTRLAPDPNKILKYRLLMDSFSWADRIRATVGTCLPCFAPGRCGTGDDSGTENEGQPARARLSNYDELERLMGDVEETDVDAETVSLHSNIGSGQRRKKKRRTKKNIQLFGYNLFGRPSIYLSESEDETQNPRARRLRISTGFPSAHSSSSLSAFDSDASPLDVATVSNPQEVAARAARELELREAEERLRQEERQQKEERRRRKKERRELKRVADALANGASMNMDGEEFEGFQGSGQHYSFNASLGSPSPSTPSAPVEEFGPYVGGSLPTPDKDEIADAEADFGGEVYTRKSRSHGSESSCSHTHSRSSASQSNFSSTHYNYLASPLPHHTSFLTSPGLQKNSVSDSPRQKKKKHSRASISQSTDKASSDSITSQSASLPSVTSPVSSALIPNEPFIVEQDGQTRFEDGPPQTENKFPSVGFGGMRRTNSSGNGVFLSRIGDD